MNKTFQIFNSKKTTIKKFFNFYNQKLFKMIFHKYVLNLINKHRDKELNVLNLFNKYKINSILNIKKISNHLKLLLIVFAIK